MECKSKETNFSFDGMSDMEQVIYKYLFAQYLGSSVVDEKDNHASTITGDIVYMFTVPKSSSVTIEDLKENWGDECLHAFGINEDSDWNTPVGIAKIMKWAMKNHIMYDASMAADKLGNDEAAQAFAEKMANQARFFYSERDEEGSRNMNPIMKSKRRSYPTWMIITKMF